MFTIEENNPETPLTPDEALGDIRKMQSRTPRFTHLPAKEARSITRFASTDPVFRKAAFDAISASPKLGDSVNTNDAALRKELEEIERWQSVLTEVDAFRDGIAATIKLRQSDLGLTASQAYAHAKQFVRRGGHSDLLPHVENMRQALRLGKRTTSAVDVKAPPVTPKA